MDDVQVACRLSTLANLTELYVGNRAAFRMRMNYSSNGIHKNLDREHGRTLLW